MRKIQLEVNQAERLVIVEALRDSARNDEKEASGKISSTQADRCMRSANAKRELANRLEQE